MIDYNLDEDTSEYLSYRINYLIEKLSKIDIIECIYLSSFKTFASLNVFNDIFIGIDIVLNDSDYYIKDTNKLITQIEIYTSVISKFLIEKGYNILFNIKSNKRSSYFKENSRQLNYIIRSTIVYDKYGIYNNITNSFNIIEPFVNKVDFNPKLKLKKI